MNEEKILVPVNFKFKVEEIHNHKDLSIKYVKKLKMGIIYPQK